MASPNDGQDQSHLNYTVLLPYTNVGPTGGDSVVQDLNVYYEVNRHDDVHVPRERLISMCSLVILLG